MWYRNKTQFYKTRYVVNVRMILIGRWAFQPQKSLRKSWTSGGQYQSDIHGKRLKCGQDEGCRKKVDCKH